MFRSTYEQERDIVLTDDHIREVWTAIQHNFKPYFDRYLASCQPPTDPEIIARTLGAKFKVKVVGRADRGLAFRAALREAIDEYKNEAAIYRSFFNEDTLQEYAEINAEEFKRALRKQQNCPIVSKCVRSRHEEMHEWQTKFNARAPRELRAVFRELYNTATDYASRTREDRYAKYDSWEKMKLDWFDDDENLRAEGVVGTGIKSTVVYHLHANIFPLSDTHAMFALYFLSGKESFGLPSGSNEFIMVNDQKADPSMIDRIDRNYWYPYPLFTLYQLRIYRLFESACSKLKVPVDAKYRYVYCTALMKHIIETPPESELVEAMRPVRDSAW